MANLASLGKIIATSSNVNLVVVELWVGGNVGNIEAQAVLFADIAGDVTEGLDLLEFTGSNYSSIAYMHVGGDLLGSIAFSDALDASGVQQLLIDGDFGSAGVSTELRCTSFGKIVCDNLWTDVDVTGFRRLEVGGDLNGDIVTADISDTLSYHGSGDPGVFVDGNLKSSVGCSYSFSGSVSIDGFLGAGGLLQLPGISSGEMVSIASGIQSDGELRITDVVEGSIDLDADLEGSIVIYDGLSGDITVPSGGLGGQILINQQNGLAEWSGDVVVGSTTLGPGETGDNEAPYYGVLSSTLGGGAVGLVPFNFHPKDSAPDHDSVVTTGAISTVQIAHYGPVSIDSGNGVRIYEATWAVPYPYPSHAEVPLCYDPPGPPTTYWQEWDGEGDFDVSVSGRVITITGDERTFTTGKAYQIIPGGLVCAGIPGTPDVVYISNWFGAWDEDNDEFCDGLPETNGYGFLIPSKFDLNLSLELETGDVDAWLTEPVDLDDDDDADVLDLAAVIDAVVNGSDE
ncbi:MAG: hypothetical protein DYG94_07545 [Leptolyngbya sp. PLA3]|nr:MAG: hypothetical protein EDM82_10550 [Cyanobacteria bacterium CYA]MCE7968584.1 hypothetical protein [Leptolyngbya sp. PL-A3]